MPSIASQIAKCGVRLILVLFLLCFIYLCHVVVTQNYHGADKDNEVHYQNDRIVEGSSASPMTLSEINRKSFSSNSSSDSISKSAVKI